MGASTHRTTSTSRSSRSCLSASPTSRSRWPCRARSTSSCTTSRGRYGKAAVNTGDEGGFAPPSPSRGGARTAPSRSGAGGVLRRGRLRPRLRRESLLRREPRRVCARGQGPLPRGHDLVYEGLAKDWGVVSFEDPLQEDDFEGFAELTRRLERRSSATTCSSPTGSAWPVPSRSGRRTPCLFKVNQAGTLSRRSTPPARRAKAGGASSSRALRRDGGPAHLGPRVASTPAR